MYKEEKPNADKILWPQFNGLNRLNYRNAIDENQGMTKEPKQNQRRTLKNHRRNKGKPANNQRSAKAYNKEELHFHRHDSIILYIEISYNIY